MSSNFLKTYLSLTNNDQMLIWPEPLAGAASGRRNTSVLFSYFQIAVNWFGRKVAWRICPQKDDSPFWVPSWFLWVSYTSAAIQLLATLFKILIQVISSLLV